MLFSFHYCTTSFPLFPSRLFSDPPLHRAAQIIQPKHHTIRHPRQTNRANQPCKRQQHQPVSDRQQHRHKRHRDENPQKNPQHRRRKHHHQLEDKYATSRTSQIGKSKTLNIFFISSALLYVLYIPHLHLFGKGAALRKKRGRSCRCFGAPPAFQFSPLSFSKSRAICSSIRSCLLLTPRMSISSITPTSFALLAIWLTLLPM